MSNVDWAALAAMTKAGLSSADIYALGAAMKAGTLPKTPTAPAPTAPTAPKPATSPTTTAAPKPLPTYTGGMTGAQPVLVTDNTGKTFLVSFNPGGTGGTRMAVDPAAISDLVEEFGAPITNVNQLPAHIRNAQTSMFGSAGGGAIALDVRLGFADAGPFDVEAHKAAGDAKAKAAQAEQANKQGALAVVREALERYGLGSLADWAWGEVQNGRSYSEIMLNLRQRPEFKNRFKAIDIRQANGLSAVSPEEIIQYEQQARDLMRQSGLPSGFYDQFDDFANLIGKGVSLQSVARRIEESWDRVVNAPTEVRAAFGDMYGIRGDQALATFMFDPDKAETQLEKMARSAVAGGAMRAAGFDLDQIAAGRLAGFDFEDQSVRAGFARLAQLRSIFIETMGERNQEDLDAMDEGVNSVFDVGAGGEAMERRVRTRVNEFAGGGGAYMTQRGLTGLRSF